jgi:hypothetical protein
LAPATGAPGPHAFAACDDRRSSRGVITSIASRLTIVTTRSPLFIEAGRAQETMIFRNSEWKYFSRGGWSKTIFFGFA